MPAEESTASLVSVSIERLLGVDQHVVKTNVELGIAKRRSMP